MDQLFPEGVVAAGDAGSLEAEAVPCEHGIELVEREPRRSRPVRDQQPGLGHLGLYRGGVDRLQQLGLQHFAGAGDFVPRQRGVGIGQEPVRRIIARFDAERAPAFHHGPLAEAEIGIDTTQGGAAGGEIVVQGEFGAIDRAVVVQFDRVLQILECLHRPVFGLLLDGFVEPGRGILGIEGLGEIELLFGDGVALLLVISLA